MRSPLTTPLRRALLAAVLVSSLVPQVPELALAQDDADLDALDSLADEGEPSAAQMRQHVLLVPFTGETADSVGAASLIEGLLLDRLGTSGHLVVTTLDDAPPVADVESRLYFEGCPRGDELGCAFVLGENANVDRVVTGRVQLVDDGFRIVVIVLQIPRAEEEFRYGIDIRGGEEGLLGRTVELALDRLRRAEIEAPRASAREREEKRREELAEAATEADRDLLRRMGVDLSDDDLASVNSQGPTRRRKLTEADLEEQDDVEGLASDWGRMGITKAQYLQFRNSGLDFDAYRKRWAGHRLQLLGSVHVGFAGGALATRYYGAHLLSPDLQEISASYAWQHSDQSSFVTVGFGGGIGILPFLDVEVHAFWTQGKVFLRLRTGTTVADAEGNLAPSPTNRPPGDWQASQVNLWGGDLMARFFFPQIPRIKPSFAVGLAWLRYPNLFNDPEIDDAEEEPPISARFQTFTQLTDVGPQFEPGVQWDANQHLGIFVRLPIFVPVHPDRARATADSPPALLADSDVPQAATPAVVRILLGVQGRLFGLPLQPRVPVDDALFEDE